MWYLWCALLLSWSAVVAAEGTGEVKSEAVVIATTTKAPHRTLERQGTDLVWKNWLQSNQNAPPRRITTKSLFITPLICPKGQRLDGNGCVDQTITLNREEIDRVVLDHLNALSSAPSDDVVYDYGDQDPGPLQLSIPIGLDPQAAPLKAQEPQALAQNTQPAYVNLDKKDENKPNDAGIVAELQLLKLQQSQNSLNDKGNAEFVGILNHSVMNNLIPSLDKPKRDSTAVNSTEIGLTSDTVDNGQKEQIYGHVNIDPVLYNTESQTEIDTENPPQDTTLINEITTVQSDTAKKPISSNTDKTPLNTNPTEHVLKKDGDKTKLNPENEYANIGERIKLISRYAEVTTDDNFSKEQNKFTNKDDSILGTRTKLHHRRNRPKPESSFPESSGQQTTETEQKSSLHKVFPKYSPYYRYPWQGQHVLTPPPDYPFRHLQDYWPGQRHIGGVYGVHENPRRHHHNYPYPHNYYKMHYLPHATNPNSGVNGYYSVQLQEYPPRAGNQYGSSAQVPAKNQDLYNLLGLRHWFSSEGTSKR